MPSHPGRKLPPAAAGSLDGFQVGIAIVDVQFDPHGQVIAHAVGAPILETAAGFLGALTGVQVLVFLAVNVLVVVEHAGAAGGVSGRFVDNGNWPLDTNPVENAIRPFVVGRKGWLYRRYRGWGQRQYQSLFAGQGQWHRAVSLSRGAVQEAPAGADCR